MGFFKSAVLVGLTAILVTIIPRCFRTDPPLIIDGFVAAGFEPVMDAFRENFETGRDSLRGGSAFAAYYRGEKIVDVWAGYADTESRQVWRKDTLGIVQSTTKSIAALCIAILVDRGLLDYDKPVAHYWPEFAQKGKDKITVQELMEHKAGLVLAPPPGLSLHLLEDVARAGEVVAASEPVWKHLDGKVHGYQAITIGPLVNELVRRVDPSHRTLGRFLAEEIAEPFGEGL